MVHGLGSLAEVVGFLVAIMVMSRACADEGLFTALGARVARRAGESSTRVLAWCVGLAAVVTAVLSLDATVVLLTPVLLAVSAHRSHAFASLRLANSASTLLPVSNLTNLLVFSATGLTFLGFAGAMLPVFVVAVLAELAVLRWWFRAELREPTAARLGGAQHVPRAVSVVVVLVLVALAAGATPWIPATVGAALAGAHALWRRRTTVAALLESAGLPLALAVLVWGAAVSWVGTTRVGDLLQDLVPAAPGLGPLLVTALLAMVVANVLNNLPATLLLLPAAEAAGSVAVLALLIGVNVGANLTVVGSLANVLWRRSGGASVTTLRELHLLGLATTPAIVVLSTVTLWAWTSVVW